MSGWPTIPLADLCDIQIGRTPRRDELKYWNGHHPWASIRDLRDRDIRETRESISDEAVASVMPEPARAGTLLVSFKLTIGRIGLASRDMHHNEAIASIPVRRTDLVEREYLRHILPGIMEREQSNRAVLGNVLNKGKLERLPIPLPPLDEQRRIVGVLDRAAQIRRRADAARAKARTIIPALFLETFGDPGTNPKGWPESSLGELLATSLSYGSMTSPKADETAYRDIRVANIRVGLINHTDTKYVALAASLVAKHTLQDGDIVLARAIGSEQHLGKCAVVFPGRERWAYDSHIMRIRVNRERLSPLWLHALMNTDGGKQRLLQRSRASAIQHNINTKEVAKFTFGVPPLPLQTAFAEHVRHLEALARQLNLAAAKAEAMAAALSAEVFG